MLDKAVHLHEQPSMEQVSSPLSAQILEFCEYDLFRETIQNSEVVSSSNCCYDDQSSYTTNITYPPDVTKNPNTINNATDTATTTKPPTTDHNINTDINNFSIIFDEELTKNDINSANLDFTTSPHLNIPPYQLVNQDHLDLTLLQNQISLAANNNININGSTPPYPHSHRNDHIVPLVGPTLSNVCQDDCLSSMPPSKFMRLNNPSLPNCSFMDPSLNAYLSGNSNPSLTVESSGIFNTNLFLGDLDFKGDNSSIFCQDPLPPPYHSNELQALRNENQHLVNGSGSSAPQLVSEITSLETETFRVTNKLTTEERKEKIHRYVKKRKARNFSKKIKYACRKTLADSRPRVRGRFAKNDEFGENNRTTCSNHEEDTDEDIKSFHAVNDNEEVVVKEEDENFESQDIFARISGVNAFNRNYPIQSWI